MSNRYDDLLRRTNVMFQLYGGAAQLTSAYTYDTASRLQTVSDGTNSAEYAYLTDSPLVDKVTFRQNGNLRMITRKAYDGLNRLTAIVSSNASAVVLSSNAYLYNLGNQRTSLTNADRTYWRYQYDVLGQVTNGWKYDASGNEISDHKYAYLFDDIGNRDKTITNTVTSDYAANLLNQYTTRVTGGNTETFYHDADGNLTNDGRWSYQWDAENHLTVMATLQGVTPEKRLEFDYDWQSRRIRKRVWSNRNGTGDPVADLRFIYDGWNLLVTLDSQLSTLNSFVWGLDLSGREQGAGGVGGLLLVRDAELGTANYACFDGNGNVMALADTSSGQSSAQYEYGPFGEPLSASGAIATANSFRFSTKYQDDETGLLYYGYRHYNAPSGRWLSRDPMEQEVGLNLYAFVENNPVFDTDLLGLAAGADAWTWGEIGTWAIKKRSKPVDLSAPSGLGDAKASISAVCSRGEKCHGDKPPPGPKANALDRAAWENIVNASGTDRSKGAKYFCVNTEPPCGHPIKCATCYCADKKKDIWKRGAGKFEIERTGELQVGSDVGGTLYFFNLKNEKDFNGWCTEQDQKNSLSHPACTEKK